MSIATADNALRETMQLIPGYDPFETAGPDCWFDEEAAQRAIAFFPGCLRHIEGAMYGQPFELEPWQEAIVGNLFGWKTIDTLGRTVRRYRKCLLYVARGNGKTPIAAGIALYILYTDTEMGQQGYVGAANKDQAGILFRHAKGMVEFEPELASRVMIFGGNAPGAQSRSIVRNLDGSFVRVISDTAQHGKALSFALVDEVHEHVRRDLVDALESAMSKANRPQPLIVFLTTADYERESICNEIYRYAKQVQQGQVKDERFLPIIYEADAKDDYRLESTWRKANPNFGVSVSADGFNEWMTKIAAVPSSLNTFLRFHLNIITQSAEQWDILDHWDDCEIKPVTLESLRGRPCWGALDKSATRDLTALALASPGEDGVMDLWVHFWVPGDIMEREREDRVPYTTWIREGWMEKTRDYSIHDDDMRVKVNEVAKCVDLRELMVDPWNALSFIEDLRGDGIEAVVHSQTCEAMNEPTKAFENLVVCGKLNHGSNPVLKWNAGNALLIRDSNENKKVSKKHATGRVDGVIASIMAVGRALRCNNSNQPSISFI